MLTLYNVYNRTNNLTILFFFLEINSPPRFLFWDVQARGWKSGRGTADGKCEILRTLFQARAFISQYKDTAEGVILYILNVIVVVKRQRWTQWSKTS